MYMPDALETLKLGGGIKGGAIVIIIIMVIIINVCIVYCYRRSTKREMQGNMQV